MLINEVLITSPLSDEAVDVHQGQEEIVRLVESRFFSVEADHKCPLQGLQGEPPLTPIQKCFVKLRIKYGVKLLLLLPHVGQQIGLASFIRLPLKTFCHFK